MCQLTFMRGDPLLVRSTLFNISAINARSGNNDGFGYYSFMSKKVFKTKKSAKEFVYTDEFLDILDRDFPITANKKTSVLSHVRSASRWGGTMQTISDENAHPFVLNNLVLAHNGTLFPKDDKDELKDSIDSYWFLHKLDSIVNGEKLKPKHIVEAMKYFEGKFALLIVDMLQPNDLWIARGKTADLHVARYVDENDKEVLFLINTKESDIENTISPHFYRILLGKKIKLKEDIKQVKTETIARYNIVSGKLGGFKGKIEEETHVIKSTTKAWNSRQTNSGVIHSYAITSLKAIMEEITNLATQNMLTYSEVYILFGMYTTGSFFTPEKDDLIAFIDVLRALTTESEYKGRLNSWIKVTELLIEEGFDVVDVYNAYPNFTFPWMLNSKKIITKLHTHIIKNMDSIRHQIKESDD